ncbi:MAG TPA: hypothetical protein QF564_30615 [Pirellulaceae bacterium]|jgi:hypothetical protein|nr:hypothetical protein [Pirellulaceae bacterium]
MFGSIKRWIRGVPPGGSAASFQPAQPPEPRERTFFREDELPGDVGEMIDGGVVTLWREDEFGRRWFKATDSDAVDWWIEIQQDNTND